jgi:uncharacterized protein YqgV (UPF0045/DUF77 family)
MTIQCQISMYPLGKTNFKKIIDECLETLNHPGISYTITIMSTLIHGELDQVFKAVEDLYKVALTKDPSFVMNATYSSLSEY